MSDEDKELDVSDLKPEAPTNIKEALDRLIRMAKLIEDHAGKVQAVEPVAEPVVEPVVEETVAEPVAELEVAVEMPSDEFLDGLLQATELPLEEVPYQVPADEPDLADVTARAELRAQLVAAHQQPAVFKLLPPRVLVPSVSPQAHIRGFLKKAQEQSSGSGGYVTRQIKGIPTTADVLYDEETKAKRKEAVDGLKNISHFLLKEVEAGHIGYLPPVAAKKTLKESLVEKVQEAKTKVEDVKKQVFFSLVNRAQKALNIR